MRATTGIFLGTTLACAAALALIGERDARACGGCFQPPPPPTETESVITDHRMVLSVTAQHTTLYDQIRFQGNPSEFAWVLPINGEATVGLSADSLFATLDVMTTTTVVAPATGCPANSNNCRTASAFAAAGGDESNGGVSIIKQEVVGPYQTVQLASSNPTALNDWLAQNGYTVAPDVAPIISAYVNAHYDFLALKLKPGANVQSMRPVRVTTAGGSPVLPLRMVAAGTGPKVGITLWVVAEGRYEAQNFPNFAIKSEDVAWDWASSTSNFTKLRADKSADGKSWETESSMSFAAQTIMSAVQYGYYGGYNGGFNGGGAGPAASNDYAPVTDANGNVTKSADEVRTEDLAVLVDQIATPRVTRLRADLAHASLAADLVLRPATDAAELSNVRNATQEVGQPQCPIFDGCTQAGTAPRDVAIARTKTTASAFACAVGDAAPGGGAPLTLVALAGFLGLALFRARRRA